LLDRQNELLVLVTFLTANARLREARDEHKRVVGNRTPNLRTPVLTRPQTGGIPPDRYSRGREYPMQLIDPRRVLPDERDEGVPRLLYPFARDIQDIEEGSASTDPWATG